jgi:threonine-phosphate decarboxylase
MTHAGPHGGNIYKMAEEIGVAEDRIIDFSASVNPLGMPESAKAEILKRLRFVHNYPDPETGEFRRAVSLRFGLNPEMVIAGNGSTEFIYLIPRALRPQRVLVCKPSFSEFERASRIAGAKVKHVGLKESNSYRIIPRDIISAMKGVEMAFLSNPNNPTGHALERDDMIEIAEAARRLKCHLVVDEAFVDFCPGNSILGVVKNPYLIVLRSMTKFYALSGLRLGFGYFPLRLMRALQRAKEPWSVNSIAQSAGIVALSDRDFVNKTHRLIEEEKRYLERCLRKIGISYYPSHVNFYLLRVKSAGKIIEGLLKKRIAVRDCSNFRGLGNGHIRVAVRSRKENRMLLRGLADVI